MCVIAISITIVIYAHSEERGMAKLLAAAENNRTRIPSPIPPRFPEEMMGEEREARVRE